MFDIVTFGSATWDIFVQTKNLKIIENDKFVTGRGIGFDLGSKFEVRDIHFSSGGGGTNTAATFAKQGFKVAYCGTIGDDLFGKEIIEELKKIGIITDFITKTDQKPTNLSVVLNIGDKEERTILVYRGASGLVNKKDIPWENIKSFLKTDREKWFYLAPLSGKSSKLTEKIIDFAHKNNIKVAVNPGNSQLRLPQRTLKEILKKIDILVLNQEEAALLTKISYNQRNEIFLKTDSICSGIVIMTMGENGIIVSDKEYIYRAVPHKIKVIDKTGAGDSFSSAFLSGLIKKSNIEYAIQLGIANASKCLKRKGAKNGLLSKNEKFKNIKILKIKYQTRFTKLWNY